jgi:MFS family permease
MVGSILPIYLVLHLRMSPLAFGVVDGIYQGSAVLLRLVSGFIGDRTRRHKAVATFGYALSAICRVGLLAAGNVWTAIAATVALDRAGKGIRTAPRDALISLNSPPRELARSFGVHRALDAAGAMLGPLCAFLLLAWMPSRFDAIFVISFCVAVVGVGVIVLFVEEAPFHHGISEAEKQPSIRDVLALWKGPAFRHLLWATALLSLATVSDAFIFLSLQQQLDFSAGLFPLLFVSVSLATFALAAPTGRVADSYGRLRVFLGGHVLLLAMYLLILLPPMNSLRVGAILILLGAYYAATDGVLAAIAASRLPRDLYGSGLALLATATNVSRLVSSILFGILWTWMGQPATTAFFMVGLTVALTAAAVMLRQELTHDPPVA